MGQRTATACYRELGARLRTAREATGMSVTEFADKLDMTQNQISRIELGYVQISRGDAIFYLGHLGVYGPAAKDAHELARTAERKLGYWLSPHGKWLEDSLTSLIFHEATANRFTSYEPLLVPGQLQTAAYARARISAELWRDAENVDQCVRIRLQRQQVMYVLRPARFTFFIHEQALRLPVGNGSIMHEQLLKLVLTDSLSHVTIRVVPLAAGALSALGGPFHLFEYNEHRPVVYLDNQSTGLFLEDHEYVLPFQELVPALTDVALDARESRELIAALADSYDRGSDRDAGDLVEEEQL